MGLRPLVVSGYTPGAYEQSAQRLIDSCREHGYRCRVKPVPCLGEWVLNTNHKPRLVREALRTTSRDVLWVDADGWINQPMPFFDDVPESGDVFLHQLRAMHPGFQAQRYRHFADRRGALWNSGIAYFRNTQAVRDLVDKWCYWSERRPREWDQVNLMMAAVGSPVSVGDIPPSYRAGKSFFGHRSGHHAAWKPRKPVRDVLLLGSAPDAPGWWARNGEAYIDRGFSVVAINNAWRVPGEHLDLWLYPNDFVGPHAPDGIPRNLGLSGVNLNSWGNWYVRPVKPKRHVSLTLLAALYHLLNESIQDKCGINLHVVGCDMQYPSRGPTHFYGTGAPDPLRFSPEVLSDALEDVRQNYEAHGATILNAGGQRVSALPFDRASELDSGARE